MVSLAGTVLGAGMLVVSILLGEEGLMSEATLRARHGSYSPFVKKTLLTLRCQPPYLVLLVLTFGPFATLFPNWLTPDEN